MDLTSIFVVTFQVLAVLVLVALNGFFVAAEFALVRLRDSQLNASVEAGDGRAKVARHILNNLDSFLSGAQLGITLASLALGWVGHPVFHTILEPIYHGLHLQEMLAPMENWMRLQPGRILDGITMFVGFSVITFLHITAGEQAPKWMAIQKPLPTSLWCAYPMLLFYKVSYPFVVGLNWSSQWMLSKVGIEPGDEHGTSHTEEELRLLFAASQEKLGGTPLGRDIVLNALDLQHRIVRDVMQPRPEIVSLHDDHTIQECLEIASSHGYSRYPLCQSGDIDQTYGVVHFKDLFIQRHNVKTGDDLRSVMHPLVYIPETARLETVLKLFLERRLHLAIVVDEYGGTVGMVTMEDILEELVGQIQDEFDEETPLLVKLGKNRYRVDGDLPLHELADLVGEELSEEGISTTSGWVTHCLKGFAKKGDVIERDGFILTVDKMAKHVVAKCRLELKPKPEEAKPGEEKAH